MNTKGMITRQSPFSVKETMDRLSAKLTENGITVYVRIDQQAEAKKGGIDIHPLEFLLFGNSAKGGKIMAANPAAALDLPLKAIAWQDNTGTVWVAYNEASYIQERYTLTPDLAKLIDIDPLMTKLLQK